MEDMDTMVNKVAELARKAGVVGQAEPISHMLVKFSVNM